MTAASIPASGGGGYARYLESKTVAPERGDYYLTPDGEMTQAPGRWLSDEETLTRLGVQAGEAVDGADFIALMDGRHPGTGRWLRPEGAGGGRGGGIDVTLEGTTDCPSRRVAVGGADCACAASLGGSDVGGGGLDES